MCQHTTGALTFEAMLSDPMIRLVMASDGVTIEQFTAILATARDATRFVDFPPREYFVERLPAEWF